MADYTFKGLTGVLGTITIADPTTATMDDVITEMASEEGLPTDYYGVSVENNPAINDVTYGDSSTPLSGVGGLSITTSDKFIATLKQSGLTKEQRQIQKLEVAQLKRQGTFRDTGAYTNASDAPYYRTLNTYDKDLLPNPYNDNSADPDDGDAGPLDDGRPWT